MAKKIVACMDGKVVDMSKLPKGMRGLNPDSAVTVIKDSPLRIFRRGKR